MNEGKWGQEKSASKPKALIALGSKGFKSCGKSKELKSSTVINGGMTIEEFIQDGCKCTG